MLLDYSQFVFLTYQFVIDIIGNFTVRYRVTSILRKTEN